MIVSLAILAILVGGGAYWVYSVRNTSISPAQNSEEAKQELADAVVKVGKLMVLPEGDEPILATVTDAEKLKAEQPFYAMVENGDKVLVFPKSQKAVIYSPSKNKLVNVGPIVSAPQGQQSQGQEAKTTPTPEPSPKKQ